MDDKQLKGVNDYLREGGKIAGTAGLISADTLLFGGYPLLTTLGELTKAHFGQAMRLRTQKALEAFEYIYNNQGAFTKEVIETEGFQEGFLAWFGKYLLLRNKEKRLGALVLFRTFAENEDRDLFPLERFMDTLDKISPSALRSLSLIKYKVILPDIYSNRGMSGRRKNVRDYASQKLSSTPLSELVERRLTEMVLMSTEEYAAYEQLESPAKEAYMREWELRARQLQEGFHKTLDELVYLGLIVKETKPSDDRFLVNSDDAKGWWRLSEFAADFIDYIELVETSEDRFDKL